MLLNRTHTFTAGLLGGALTLGAFNIANAASKTTINSCVNKTTGAMRYLANGSCKVTETKLTWNVTGPQGLAGLQGPRGDNGPAGTVGATGATGSSGPTGPVGATGAPGAAGLNGVTGSAGLTGSTGPRGDTGPVGDTGAKGDTGPRGPGAVAVPIDVSVADSKVSVNSISLVDYVPILEVGSNIEISAAVGPNPYSSKWSLAVRAPIGSFVYGFARSYSSGTYDDNGFGRIYVEPNGARQRLGNGPLFLGCSCNDAYITLTIWGPSTPPVNVILIPKYIDSGTYTNGYRMVGWAQEFE